MDIREMLSEVPTTGGDPMDLSRFPRLNLFPRPTPLQELPWLRKALGCKPRVFAKRDDLTQVGLGGNKNRKLDFVMAEAMAQGADTVITWAGVQSNHCRQTLAVARHLGLECHLVLTGTEPAVRQGNLLVFTILGAHLHFVGGDGDGEREAFWVAEDVRRGGHTPYIVPIAASTPLGALGYVESTLEAAEQSKDLGASFGHAFLATGSGGTQAGVEVGAREALPDMRVHGISVGRPAGSRRESVANLVNKTYAMLGIDKSVSSDDIIVHDQYHGGKYGVPTEAGNEAIRLVGRTEGLLLDPVYTGKAMSGMIDMLRSGVLDDSEAVLFFHTGGFPALFAFAEDFQQ